MVKPSYLWLYHSGQYLPFRINFRALPAYMLSARSRTKFTALNCIAWSGKLEKPRLHPRTSSRCR